MNLPIQATLLFSIGIFLDPSFGASIKGGRITGFLDRLGSIFLETKEAKTPLEESLRECDDLGGTFAAPQCLEIISMERNFQDARIFCQSKGGDLWTPVRRDFDHAFASHRFAQNFPEMFKSSKNEFYIGVARTSSGGAKNLKGEDVSKSPLVRLAGAPNPSGNCFLLGADGLHLRGRMVSCSGRRPFICEY